MKTRIFVLLSIALGLLGWVKFGHAEAPPHFAAVQEKSIKLLAADGAVGCEVTYQGEAKDYEGLDGVPGMPHYFKVKCSSIEKVCTFVLHPTEAKWAGPIECLPNPDYRPIIKSDGWTDKPV